MSTITDLELSTSGVDSRPIINTNFDNLNTDKAELAGDTFTGQINFSGTTHAGIKFISLTTTERDALTPANGIAIYNETSNDTEFYTNGSWSGLSTGAPDSTTAIKGIVLMSTAPAVSTSPIAVGDNDARVPTTDENDALVGTSGTPSSSNKYVTDDDTSATSSASKVIRANASGDIADEFLNLTTAGDLPYTDGTDLTRLPIGTANQLLQVNSGATAPEWGDPTFVGSQQAGAFWSYPLFWDADETILSGSGTVTTHGAYIEVDSTVNPQLAYLPLIGTGSSDTFLWSGGKDLIVQWRGRFTASGAASFMGVSQMSGFFEVTDKDHAAGFAYNGAVLKSWSDDGSTIESNNIAAITATNWNTYRIEVTVGTDVKFYVNGALKFTHSTNIPASGNGRFGLNQASGSSGNVNKCSVPIISLEV